MERLPQEPYDLFVRFTVAARLRAMMLAGAFLYVLFNFLDHIIYPLQAPEFFVIRAAVSLMMLAVFFVSSMPKVQKYILYVYMAILYVCALGIILMTYRTEGISSIYREGLNLVLFAILFINGFKRWHQLGLCLSIFATYFLFCYLQNPVWGWYAFSNSFFFTGSMVFFVLIMTWHYSKRNFEQFLMSEKLKENEKRLELSYAQAKLEAERDTLTKVFNRKAIYNILEKKIEVCLASGKSFYLIFFDIDRFKKINDTHGHLIGDEVIKLIVDTIKSLLRSDTEIGRYGGDEFMFIIDETTPQVFFTRMEQIRDAVRDIRYKANSETLELSVSLGAAEFVPGFVNELTELVHLADSATLHLKQNNRRGEVYLINPGGRIKGFSGWYTRNAPKTFAA